jgi:hypothetical protein
MATRTQTTEAKSLLVCASCGAAPADQAGARLTWSKSVDRGRTDWMCDRCSRDNIRSIEGKLDSDWW